MSSLKNKYREAMKKIKEGNVDDVNIADLLEEDVLIDTQDFIRYWTANRTEVKVHVESYIYDCFTQITTYEFNSNENSSAKIINQMVHKRIKRLLDDISVSFKHASPSIQRHVKTIPKPVDMGVGVLLVYTIDINKNDLNYLKVKSPKLYHEITSYTTDKPMRLG